MMRSDKLKELELDFASYLKGENKHEIIINQQPTENSNNKNEQGIIITRQNGIENIIDKFNSVYDFEE